MWLDRDGKRTVKSKTLIAKAGNGAWPVGAAEIDGKPFVALVEGGPDFLAAWHFLWFCGRWGDVAPVAVLGAGIRVHRDALPYFAGKGIWTFGHNDGGKGAAAVFQWTRQLRSAGAAWVKPFDFSAYTLPDRRRCKDLNLLVQCAGFGLGDEQEEDTHG